MTKRCAHAWESPHAFALNVEPVRCTSIPYPDRAAALSGAPSPWVCSLDGEWRGREVLLRFGMQAQIPGRYSRLTWFGRGTLLGSSAWPYTQQDLEAATHIHELPRRDTITLNVDYGQRGRRNEVGNKVVSGVLPQDITSVGGFLGQRFRANRVNRLKDPALAADAANQGAIRGEYRVLVEYERPRAE
jgi:hypothetical protein